MTVPLLSVNAEKCGPAYAAGIEIHHAPCALDHVRVPGALRPDRRRILAKGFPVADSNWHRDSNWHYADSNWHRDSNWH